MMVRGVEFRVARQKQGEQPSVEQVWAKGRRKGHEPSIVAGAGCFQRPRRDDQWEVSFGLRDVMKCR